MSKTKFFECNFRYLWMKFVLAASVSIIVNLCYAYKIKQFKVRISLKFQFNIIICYKEFNNVSHKLQQLLTNKCIILKNVQN